MIPFDKNRGLLLSTMGLGTQNAGTIPTPFSSSAYAPVEARAPISTRRRPPAPELHSDPEEPLADSVRRAVEIHADKPARPIR